MAAAPHDARPDVVRLAVLGAVVLVGHSDVGLSAMLTLGWVAVVPLGYGMARLPRSKAARWIHATILGLYGLFEVTEVSFVDDRLDVLLRIMVVLLATELLWWVARASYEARVLRLVRGVVRLVVLPYAVFVCTCAPMGALAGPIDTWRETIVAEYEGPEHEEYVAVYDPPGVLTHFKIFTLYRVVPQLSFLERTLGRYGTGERYYDFEHRFAWTTAEDGRRSLMITARFCHDDEGGRSTYEGEVSANAGWSRTLALRELGTWPPVWPEEVDSNLDTCRW